jgi:hypothetical protein
MDAGVSGIGAASISKRLFAFWGWKPACKGTLDNKIVVAVTAEV